MKRSNKLFIEDIIESIDKIEDYIKDMSYEEFIDEQMVIDAVIRNLEVIGEAAKNLSDDIKNKYKNIPWKRIIGLRNIVIHGYFGIDLSIIWEIVTKNLQDIKPNIENINEKID